MSEESRTLLYTESVSELNTNLGSEKNSKIYVESRDQDRDRPHATSNLDTCAHLIKSNIGTGLLGLPAAVMHAGIVVGPVCLAVMAIISVHCMHLLVESSHVWCKMKRKSAMGFSEIAAECMEKFYPGKGWVGSIVVNVFLCVTQLGFCCVYVLFVGRNIEQIVSNYSTFNVSITIWIIIIVPYFVAFSYIKNLTAISWLSLISIFCMILGVIFIFYHLISNIGDPSGLPAFAGVDTLPLFFGVAIYAYEGIGLILPLENQMKKPENFSWILNLCMAFVTILYVSMGLFGYLMCKEQCKGSITLNLGSGIFVTITKCLITAGIFLTYFIQVYVPFDILEPWFLKHILKGESFFKSLVFRTFVVVFTGVLASVIPQLDNFIALVGALSSSALALVFPAVFHSISCPDLSKIVHTKNIAIAIFGSVGGIFGTFVSIKSIIDNY